MLDQAFFHQCLGHNAAKLGDIESRTASQEFKPPNKLFGTFRIGATQNHFTWNF